MGVLLFLLFLLLNAGGTLQQRAEPVVVETTYEISPGLAVVSVYGARESTEGPLTSLRLMFELRAGSLPTDLTRAMLRYAEGEHAQVYTFGEADASDQFVAFWIRGAGNDGVMLPGDLAELRFAPPSPLATRRDVQLTLVPEMGVAAGADFRTPPTFGSDLVVTLR